MKDCKTVKTVKEEGIGVVLPNRLTITPEVQSFLSKVVGSTYYYYLPKKTDIYNIKVGLPNRLTPKQILEFLIKSYDLALNSTFRASILYTLHNLNCLHLSGFCRIIGYHKSNILDGLTRLNSNGLLEKVDQNKAKFSKTRRFILSRDIYQKSVASYHTKSSKWYILTKLGKSIIEVFFPLIDEKIDEETKKNIEDWKKNLAKSMKNIKREEKMKRNHKKELARLEELKSRKEEEQGEFLKLQREAEAIIISKKIRVELSMKQILQNELKKAKYKETTEQNYQDWLKDVGLEQWIRNMKLRLESGDKK